MERVGVDDITDVPFVTCLKLTGNLTGHLFLPTSTKRISDFCQQNRLNSARRKTIMLLNQEAGMNIFQIWITKRDD